MAAASAKRKEPSAESNFVPIVWHDAQLDYNFAVPSAPSHTQLSMEKLTTLMQTQSVVSATTAAAYKRTRTGVLVPSTTMRPEVVVQEGGVEFTLIANKLGQSVSETTTTLDKLANILRDPDTRQFLSHEVAGCVADPIQTAHDLIKNCDGGQPYLASTAESPIKNQLRSQVQTAARSRIRAENAKDPFFTTKDSEFFYALLRTPLFIVSTQAWSPSTPDASLTLGPNRRYAFGPLLFSYAIEIVLHRLDEIPNPLVNLGTYMRMRMVNSGNRYHFLIGRAGVPITDLSDSTATLLPGQLGVVIAHTIQQAQRIQERILSASDDRFRSALAEARVMMTQVEEEKKEEAGIAAAEPAPGFISRLADVFPALTAVRGHTTAVVRTGFHFAYLRWTRFQETHLVRQNSTKGSTEMPQKDRTTNSLHHALGTMQL